MITRRKKNLLWLTLLIVIVVAVGAAFTDSNTVTAHAGETLGLGDATTTGATINSIAYTPDNTDGTLIKTVTFIADGDLSPSGPSIPSVHGWTSFNYDPGTGAVESGSIDCGTGVRAGAGPYTTTFTCNVLSLSIHIHDIKTTHIVVAS